MYKKGGGTGEETSVYSFPCGSNMTGWRASVEYYHVTQAFQTNNYWMKQIFVRRMLLLTVLILCMEGYYIFIKKVKVFIFSPSKSKSTFVIPVLFLII